MQLAEGDRGYNFLYLYFAERKTGGGPEKDNELPRAAQPDRPAPLPNVLRAVLISPLGNAPPLESRASK